jgi:hypothetical protein
MAREASLMKGPFALLLVGGGIVLIVGLFTGKIVFSLPGTAAPAATVTPTPQLKGEAPPPVARKSNAS